MKPLKILICLNCEATLSKPISIDHTVYKLSDFPTPHEYTVEETHGITVRMQFSENNCKGVFLNQNAKSSYEDRIWCHYNDVKNYLTLAAQMDIGCCGPTGRVNSHCSCQSFVGRDYRDCLMSKFFTPEPKQTEWIDFIHDQHKRNQNYADRISNPARRKHHGLFLRDLT